MANLWETKIKMQLKNLACIKEYIIEFKGRKFVIGNRGDMIQLIRLQDKCFKKEKRRNEEKR